MLSIQIDGEWTQTDDRSLVELILDGRVDELTPARDPAKSMAACPLIELLQPPQLELLTRRILQRLPGLYVTDPSSTSLAELLERVGRLRIWNWADHMVKGRLGWLDAWLAELAGFTERAIRSYDAYLRGLSQEPVLRLLACNNRGVLRVRMRQAEGIRDLARAAIPVDDTSRLSKGMRLPAACFNLLNLLTYAFNRHPLRDQVEDILVDFMIQLPRRVRERCLGPDAVAPQATEEAGLPSEPPPEASTEDLPAPRSGDEDAEDQDARRQRLRKRLRILKDASFVRLNRLIVYLVDEASEICPASDRVCTLETVAAQLQLWAGEPIQDLAETRSLSDALARQRREREQLDRCAEAASLLYASDIPSSLVPGDGSISWVRQYADKALGLVDEYCKDAEYRLAENTLVSLTSALEKSNGDPLVETVREEVADRLAEVRHRAQAHEQLDLYQTCTDLVGRVKEFCGRTDLCQAEFDAEALLRRVTQAQERLATVDASGGDAGPLLGEMPERIQKHMDRLRREDVEQRICRAKEQLYAACPKDWREPVRREAYEALRKCQVNDPACLVEDWRAWRSRLDRHQAQYHFRRALEDVTEGGMREKDARDMLDQALGFDPQLTPASAPLYCLLALRKLENPPEDLVQTKADILNAAKELLEMEPLGPEAMWSPAVRTTLVQEACVLLERLIQAYHGVGAQLDELWQALEQGFAPAFAEAPPQVLREILTLLDTCLAACPIHNAGRISSIDPRNRLRVLRQTCSRVIVVAKGEEALHDVRLDEACGCFREGIEALALERPLSDPDVQLLRRAACGWYLAAFGKQDPVHLQRRVLDRIDRWMDRIEGEDRGEDFSMQHVETLIAAARAEPVIGRLARVENDGHGS